MPYRSVDVHGIELLKRDESDDVFVGDVTFTYEYCSVMSASEAVKTKTAAPDGALLTAGGVE